MNIPGEWITEPARHTHVLREVDVAVVGGGPSGVCAAIAAARTGASTILLERAGFLGGTATGAMVASFMGYCWRNRRVTGGIADEILRGLADAGGGPGFMHYVMAEATDHPYDVFTYPFDPEVLKFVLDDLVAASGVEVMLHSQVVAPFIQDDGTVGGVIVEGRSGRDLVRAKVVVDAGADGLIARGAGARALNQAQDRRSRQPMTLMARLTEVDVKRFRALPRQDKQRLSRAGMASGELAQRIMSVVSAPGGTDAFILMTRVSGYDGADSVDLTAAEFEGRRQARAVIAFLKREVPGFEQCRLVTLAPWIGIRETWQIEGDYVLTGEDVIAGRQFYDGIALGGGPLDLHHPVGGDITLLEPAQPFATPYRCLLPTGVENLLVTGRSVSATMEAHGALRHMGSAMALGQAAGTAAGIAVKQGTTPRLVKTDDLRALLLEHDACIDVETVLHSDTPTISATVN
ncbi:MULTISPECIES: FAD-dependent oxidoreductase [unclassified Arthrobacter]|uniref:FAD-dependent oxidoreductase n=1 Tax=unclassified Arthrobacter TaxID=235627 RepID=UPI0027D84457|nr:MULTISPECIES: FAD-dependent oxidoreductase [unclassified Arthrobacter]